MCSLPLLLLQLLLPIVVVVAPGRGDSMEGKLSGTLIARLHVDDEERPGTTFDSNSTILPAQGLPLPLANGGDGSGSSNIIISHQHHEPDDNSKSGTLPTAQPLVQKWNRVQQVYPMRPGPRRHHLPSGRTEYLHRQYQNFLRSSPKSPPMQGSHARRHSGSTQSQEHLNSGRGSSVPTRESNLGIDLPAQHRENAFDAGYRGQSGILGNQFFDPKGGLRRASRPDPFTRPQQYPRLQSRGHPDARQKIFGRPSGDLNKESLKEPGPEISVHDLTSAFYKARELLATGSALEASSTYDVHRAIAQSSDTKGNKPAIMTSRYDSVRLRASPESVYYPARQHERPQYMTQRVHDSNHYPPSVSYGEPYFEQHLPPRIAQSLLLETVPHSSTNYRRSGPHGTQSSFGNMYSSDTNTRHLSLYSHLASQSLDDPVYRNQKLNSRKDIKRLNYARLPNGYQSPTTTFEELFNEDDGKKIGSEAKMHQPLVLFNGHGRNHFA